MGKQNIITYTLATAIGLGSAAPAHAGLLDFFTKWGKGGAKAAEEAAPGAGARAAKDGAIGSNGSRRTILEITKHIDEIQHVTAGVFKSFKLRFESGHYWATQGRDSEAEKLFSKLNSMDQEIIGIQGTKGTGKTQLLVGLQERINEGSVPGLLREGHVIQLNCDHNALSDFTKMDGFFESLKLQLTGQTGPVILAFSDVARFLTQDATKSKQFSSLLELARRKLGGDRLVKFVVEGTEDELNKMGDAFGVAKNASRVRVKAVTPIEAMKMARNIANMMKSEVKGAAFEITDEVLNQAIKLAELHLGYMGMPASVKKLIMGAYGLRQSTLFNRNNPVTEELRHIRELLSAEKYRLEQAAPSATHGVHAQERLKQLANEIMGLDVQIGRLDKNFLDLKAKQQELEELKNEFKGLAKAGKGDTKAPPDKVTRFNELQRDINQVSEDELARWISEETGRPIEEILLKEVTVDDLIKDLSENFFGQEEAVRLAIDAANEAKFLVRGGDRPIRSELYLGPPATGKTELSKILGRFMGKWLRWDMSEFQEETMIYRLTGAPPGHVGFHNAAGIENHGEIVNAMEDFPRATALFDEVHLADYSFFKLLYQMLDAGRMTGGTGKTGSAKNWIIVMTMNLGWEAIAKKQKELGRKLERHELIEVLMEESRNIGKPIDPAIFSRIDDIVVFDPHDLEGFKRIMGKEINAFRADLSAQLRGIHVDQAVIEKLMEPVVAGQVDARQINRIINNAIKRKVNLIINGNFRQAGLSSPMRFAEGDKILVQLNEQGEIVFKIAEKVDEALPAVGRPTTVPRPLLETIRQNVNEAGQAAPQAN